MMIQAMALSLQVLTDRQQMSEPGSCETTSCLHLLAGCPGTSMLAVIGGALDMERPCVETVAD